MLNLHVFELHSRLAKPFGWFGAPPSRATGLWPFFSVAALHTKWLREEGRIVDRPRGHAALREAALQQQQQQQQQQTQQQLQQQQQLQLQQLRQQQQGRQQQQLWQRQQQQQQQHGGLRPGPMYGMRPT